MLMKHIYSLIKYNPGQKMFTVAPQVLRYCWHFLLPFSIFPYLECK